jgi:dihydrofolate reductase
MIKHTQDGKTHEVTPMTEKAARFLNTFVGRTIIMTDKMWESVAMEMGAHKIWVMGQ